jgi:spermidine synthase
MLRPGTLHKTIPVGAVGNARVVHDSPDTLTRLRAARDGQPLNAQTYTRLIVDGQLWMTDAEFECWTNTDFVRKAFGDVLVAGLGLGLVLPPLLDSKVVESVTVLERSADVIALIGPLYQHPKLTIIEADARTWEPPKKAYHFVYFDIWADVPNSDTLKDIAALKQRYRVSLRKHGRTMAWCEDFARRGR